MRPLSETSPNLASSILRTATFMREMEESSTEFRTNIQALGLSIDPKLSGSFQRKLLTLEKRIQTNSNALAYLASQPVTTQTQEDLRTIANDVKVIAELLRENARQINPRFLRGALQATTSFVATSHTLKAELDRQIELVTDLAVTGGVSVFQNPNIVTLQSEAEKAYQLAESIVPALYPIRELVDDLPPFAATHKTDVAALQDFFSGSQIDFFGFGELHPPKEAESTTALEYYARNIVPWLVKEHGVEIFGFEFLPENITPELSRYFDTGQIHSATTPDLFWWQNIIGKSFVTFLQSIRLLKASHPQISLHGISPPVPVCQTEHDIIKMFDLMNANSTQLILTAQQRGKKAALYTGADHCKVDPEPIGNCSYVPRLARAGVDLSRFRETRLLVPKYTQHNFNNPGDWVLAQRAPAHGVTLVARKPTACVITYAKV